MPARINLLFVCSRNRWRSPTAEAIYRGDPRVAVRSAGVGAQARRTLTAADLAWADLVLVMERAHAARIRGDFGHEATLPAIGCLDIPDDYPFMDPELIELIRGGTESQLAGLL